MEFNGIYKLNNFNINVRIEREKFVPIIVIRSYFLASRYRK